MSKIVFYVEGAMEKKFLSKVCPGSKIIIVGYGINVTPAAMANQIHGFFLGTMNRYRYHVVWVDLEKRRATSQEFLSELQQELIVKKDVDLCAWSFGCPDQMTENWILADEEFISEEFGIQDYNYEFEGSGGKSKLKRYYKTKFPSRNYNELADGSRYLSKINLSSVYENSLSARSFFEALRVKKIPCDWISNKFPELIN